MKIVGMRTIFCSIIRSFQMPTSLKRLLMLFELAIREGNYSIPCSAPEILRNWPHGRHSGLTLHCLVPFRNLGIAVNWTIACLQHFPFCRLFLAETRSFAGIVTEGGRFAETMICGNYLPVNCRYVKWAEGKGWCVLRSAGNSTANGCCPFFGNQIWVDFWPHSFI